mgnify:CR=1 FL=1
MHTKVTQGAQRFPADCGATKAAVGFVCFFMSFGVSGNIISVIINELHYEFCTPTMVKVGYDGARRFVTALPCVDTAVAALVLVAQQR